MNVTLKLKDNPIEGCFLNPRGGVFLLFLAAGFIVCGFMVIVAGTPNSQTDWNCITGVMTTCVLGGIVLESLNREPAYVPRLSFFSGKTLVDRHKRASVEAEYTTHVWDVADDAPAIYLSLDEGSAIEKVLINGDPVVPEFLETIYGRPQWKVEFENSQKL